MSTDPGAQEIYDRNAVSRFLPGSAIIEERISVLPPQVLFFSIFRPSIVCGIPIVMHGMGCINVKDNGPKIGNSQRVDPSPSLH